MLRCTTDSLFNGSYKSPQYAGILNELGLRTAFNGHKGDNGVLFHGIPDGDAFYAKSARPQWPSEPMCFVEVKVVSLNTVNGGMRGSYCATRSPSDLYRKVQLRALRIREETFFALQNLRPAQCRLCLPPRTSATV